MPTYISGSYVLIDGSLVRANQSTASAVTSQAYYKLQPRATDPFKLFEVHDRSLVVDGNRIHEKIFIDHGTDTSITLLSALRLAN